MYAETSLLELPHPTTY